jgi:putative transposase
VSRRSRERSHATAGPRIFNTDQSLPRRKAGGSQFTSDDFTGTLKRHEIAISMDGKGRYMDNIFVERL